MKVYIAAPFGRWSRAKRLRTMLRAAGYTCASEWIDDAERLGGRESTGNVGVMRDALARNDHDVLTSDVLIALTFPAEGGEMFCEATLARLSGIPVLWAGERQIGSSVREGCHAFDDVADALRWLMSRGDVERVTGGAS